MRKYKQDPLWHKVADKLEEHLAGDVEYFNKGISHHEDVADKLKGELADASDTELKKELDDRLEDTAGDIGRMEKELRERKEELGITADAIVEKKVPADRAIGKKAPVVDEGDVAKPQPRYELQNKPKK